MIETLRNWARASGRDRRGRPRIPAEKRMRLREREMPEPRRANEIPCTASAWFAIAELGRCRDDAWKHLHHTCREIAA